MSLMEEYLLKPLSDLERLLHRLNDELEEVEEERMFVMGQTGIHLPGAAVKKYEAEVQSLKNKIEACESAIREKMAS